MPKKLKTLSETIEQEAAVYEEVAVAVAPPEPAKKTIRRSELPTDKDLGADGKPIDRCAWLRERNLKSVSLYEVRVGSRPSSDERPYDPESYEANDETDAIGKFVMKNGLNGKELHHYSFQVKKVAD